MRTLRSQMRLLCWRLCIHCSCNHINSFLRPGSLSIWSLFEWFLQKAQLYHLVTVKTRVYTKWNYELSIWLKLKNNYFDSLWHNLLSFTKCYYCSQLLFVYPPNFHDNLIRYRALSINYFIVKKTKAQLAWIHKTSKWWSSNQGFWRPEMAKQLSFSSVGGGGVLGMETGPHTWSKASALPLSYPQSWAIISIHFIKIDTT